MLVVCEIFVINVWILMWRVLSCVSLFWWVFVKVLFVWIVFCCVGGVLLFWIDVVGVCLLLFDCIEVLLMFVSVSVGCFFVCFCFCGSGCGVERVGCEIILLFFVLYLVFSWDWGIVECYWVIVGWLGGFFGVWCFCGWEFFWVIEYFFVLFVFVLGRLWCLCWILVVLMWSCFWSCI